MLEKYEEKGSSELDEDKLSLLLNLKYHAIANAEQILGNVDNIRAVFWRLQEGLYTKNIKK